MTKQSPLPPLTTDEQKQQLIQLFKALMQARRSVPDLTLNDVLALLFLTIETVDRTKSKLPTVSDVTRAIEVSPSYASRLLTELSGRSARAGQDPRKPQLIDSLDNVSGISKALRAYVLSAEGREFMHRFVERLSGRPAPGFDPHDADSLFRALFQDYASD